VANTVNWDRIERWLIIALLIILFFPTTIEILPNFIGTEKISDIGITSHVSGRGYLSINLLESTSMKTLNISSIPSNKNFTYWGHIIAINYGDVDTSIDLYVNSEFSPLIFSNMFKKNQSKSLKVGKNPNISDISIRIYIGVNSTYHRNFVNLSDLTENRFHAGIIKPNEELMFFYYVKKFNDTATGEFISDFTVIHEGSGVGDFPNTYKKYINIEETHLGNIIKENLEFNIKFITIEKTLVLEGGNQSNQSKIYNFDESFYVTGKSYCFPFEILRGSKKISDIKSAPYYSLINKHLKFTTLDWEISIDEENDELNISLERVRERNIFYFILLLSGLTLVYRIYVYKKSKKSDSLDKSKTLGLIPIISIVIYYITYTSPSIINIGNIMLILSAILVYHDKVIILLSEPFSFKVS